MKERSRYWVEWPTLCLILLSYAGWVAGTTFLSAVWLPLGIAISVLAMALHSSLQHEVIHGHPVANRTIAQGLVFPSLILFIPYLRFRDTHLAHHQDALLTDPYDDPESNYLDPEVWERLSRPVQVVLALNNTLLGRLVLGPAIAQVVFMLGDWRKMRAGDESVLRGWLWHIPAVAPVVLWLTFVGQMPVWAYFLSVYAAISILKIRTFLEHQAHERARGWTVIIEDRGILAFLFLNNNLHVVHHMHPRVAWYRLPELYFSNRERYLRRNDGYSYPSYAEVFRKHLLRAKDPVPHPIWRRS